MLYSTKDPKVDEEKDKNRKGIYHNILANRVTENLKVFLESLGEGGHFKPWGHSGKLAIVT